MCEWKKHGDTRIDPCMRRLIDWINYSNYETVSCCCGHNRYPMTIVIRFMNNGVPEFIEILSKTMIPRSRRFYKRDSVGYYYIPEVMDLSSAL